MTLSPAGIVTSVEFFFSYKFCKITFERLRQRCRRRDETLKNKKVDASNRKLGRNDSEHLERRKNCDHH